MKTALAFLLVAAASLSALGQEWVNLPAQIKGRPQWIANTFNPTDEMLLASGWRKLYPEDVPSLAAGSVRVVSHWSQHPEHADRAVETAEDRTAEEAYAIEHAPTSFANGVQVQWVYWPASPDATNGWVEAIDEDGNHLLAHWYGSPTSTVAEIAADLSGQAANNKTFSALMASLKESIGTNLVAWEADKAAAKAVSDQTAALTFSATPTKAQCEALAAQVKELADIIASIAKDGKQTQQDVRTLRTCVAKDPGP